MSNNRLIWAVVAGGGAGGLYLATKAVSRREVPIQTPGVSAIETRYSSGGGARDHLPGGGTPRGKPDVTAGKVETLKGDAKVTHAEQSSSNLVVSRKPKDQ